ncbi:DNA/RNA polymerases superfamily protein [Gossypium australe]|uniref:DNA/RNA polymerases superfamily protein n=1 Tax=Gossypium australe TaxID=47621 RepID=A0A5B6WR81_9ROSI|nr:DNA/RNA polymerases superfamily protein [Gossypium australe]
MVFIDDILVYSRTVEHLRDLLRTLSENKFTPNSANLREVCFLGHIIFTEGVKVDLNKFKSILDWNLSKNVTEVHSFLGLASYYKRFVKGFAMLATPLTHLLKKKEKFEWIEACQKSFNKLKVILTEAYILAQPESGMEYTVFTDASLNGLGCVLMCAKYLELATVVLTLKIWKHYLCRKKCCVFSDHKSVKYLMTQKDLNLRQRHWMEILKDCDVAIECHLGEANMVADALASLRANVYLADDGSLLAELILKDAQCECIPSNESTSFSLGKMVNSDSWEGCMCQLEMPGMKKEITEYVSSCLTCQWIKAKHQIPEWKWDKITMDFVSGFPLSPSKKNSVWVIIDRLTKPVHFLPLHPNYSLKNLVEL